ncbi:phosphopantetheine-binding protein [Pseudomonas chlororaphis]|uniref:phosphopantetheine-binding protein n=1 Tax=Pseudomonas chlororaphis TaxID=587753 RepID=UPI0030CC14D4
MIKPDAVLPGARFVEDLGADSLNMLEIVLDINEILEIEMPTEGLACIRSVEDLHRLVGRSLS